MINFSLSFLKIALEKTSNYLSNLLLKCLKCLPMSVRGNPLAINFKSVSWKSLLSNISGFILTFSTCHHIQNCLLHHVWYFCQFRTFCHKVEYFAPYPPDYNNENNGVLYHYFCGKKNPAMILQKCSLDYIKGDYFCILKM